jgi:hypothetical protein
MFSKLLFESAVEIFTMDSNFCRTLIRQDVHGSLAEEFLQAISNSLKKWLDSKPIVIE